MDKLILIIGSFGVIQSFFMSLFILLAKKRTAANSLLILLFLLLTVRIAKSMLWLYGESIPVSILNIGFAAHLATAPTLFLYIYLLLQRRSVKKIEVLHFLPALLILILALQLTLNGFWYQGGYAALLFHQMAYTTITLILMVYYFSQDSLRKALTKQQKLWTCILFIGVSSIQIAYFANYILGAINYAAAPQIYAFFIFIIALFGVVNHKVFDDKAKYANIKLSDRQFDGYKKKIEAFMNSEKPYLDEGLSLKELSSALKLNSYLVSHVINKGFGLSVTEYINSFRIHEVKNKLLDSDYSNIKISEIAYECGFGTLSVFNAYFKKKTGTTPSKYRKKHR